MKKFNIDKEMVKTVGVAAGKIGKAIIIEGIKGVLLKSAANAINTSFESGVDGIKKMTIDDFVGRKKKKLVELKNVIVEDEVEVILADDMYHVKENVIDSK